MIKVQNVIDCYEVDGQEVKSAVSNAKRSSVTIRSHWNRNDFVVLEIGERAFTVLLKDLVAAAENASNSAK